LCQVVLPANTSKAVRMRGTSWSLLMAGAVLAGGWCASAAAQTASANQAAGQDQSVADAARRARADKKTEPQSAKHVWDDDNIPKNPRDVTATSAEGGAAACEGENCDKAAQDAQGAKGTAGAPGPEDDAKKSADLEAKWRDRFAVAHKKLDDDEKEADLMQREYNLKRQQYYSDPNTAMREQYQYPSGRGGDLNDLAKKIDEKKADVEKDKQAISDLEDELRKAGLPPGWSRP